MVRLFLLPGVWGDEPQLEALRHNLAGLLDVELVELPKIGAPGSVIASMRGTACFVADEIDVRQPEGAISIAGYSFGASAALETACELIRRGRSVNFLGVLDGPLKLEEVRQLYALLEPIARIRQAETLMLGSVAAIDTARKLPAAVAARDHSPRAPSEAMRRGVLTFLRSKALHGWKPTPCLANGLHVFTDLYGDANRARWATLCPNLRPVRLDARHTEMMQGASLHLISDALLQAMDPSRTRNHPYPLQELAGSSTDHIDLAASHAKTPRQRLAGTIAKRKASWIREGLVDRVRHLKGEDSLRHATIQSIRPKGEAADDIAADRHPSDESVLGSKLT